MPAARWRDLVRLLPGAGGGLVVALAVAVAVDAALPLATIAATGRLISRVTTGPEVGEVAGPLAAIAGLFALRQVLDPIRGVLTYLAASRIDGRLRERAMAAAMLAPGVAFLEDTATQDLVTEAGTRANPFRPASPGGAAVGVVGLLAKYAQGVGAALLIARFEPWLGAVMLVAVVCFRRPHHRDNLALVHAFNGHFPTYRRARYLSGLLMEPPAAKEARVFGLAPWVLERHTSTWRTVTGAMSTVRRRTRGRLGIYYLLMVPLNALSFLVAGYAALDGRIDAGQLAVVLQASLQLLALGSIGFEESQIDFGAASLPAVTALEDGARAAAAGGAVRAEAAPAANASEKPQHEIRFEGVRFAYPDGRPVFDGLDLTIAAGTSLAIVGANGAGKTTLVKLLARLYEPSSGRILVDGTDLRDLDVASWRAQLAVIFADFVRYELSAADNVGFRRAGTDAVRRAAARAGTAELVEALPHGWDTVLSRGYRDGADLSGGEWQRVALARALFAVDQGARVLALDEPTANLDVRAEAALFDRLLDVTGGPGQMVTTLLISHRFSTVRRAERICVLDGGRVVEDGTHDSLLAAGGRYARMFTLQASRFDG